MPSADWRLTAGDGRRIYGRAGCEREEQSKGTWKREDRSRVQLWLARLSDPKPCRKKYAVPSLLTLGVGVIDCPT